MNKPPLILLYGLDEISQEFEIEATNALVTAASDALRARGWRVDVVKLEHDIVTPLKPYDPSEWIVLNLCEGSPAQDFYYAQVARVLETLGFTFTGSDCRCLDQTQYKSSMKQLLDERNVPTPRWAVYTDASNVHFGVYPAIVKPSSEHCSMGITRESVVLNDEQARAQVEHTLKEFRGEVVVEEFLDSPEYNVTVWGSQHHAGGNLAVLGISSMLYDAFDDIHDRLCTFEAKWDPASAAYQTIPAICPAPVSEELREKIERVALAAYLAGGCRDYARVDMRLCGQQPMALDINANCDVSPGGGFDNAARAAGLSYAEMLEQIVLFAMQRRESAMPQETSPVATDGLLPIGVPAVA